MAKVKKKEIKLVKSEMLKVTEANRKFCITNGRAIYIWGAGMTCLSPDVARLTIRPRRQKNTYVIEDGVEFRITNDEDREEYADFYVTMVDKYIKQGKLFIDPKEPLMKIEIQDKNGDPIFKTKVETKEEVVKEVKPVQTNPFNIE